MWESLEDAMPNNGKEARTGGLGPMRQPTKSIWSERVLLLLILASLAGTLNLILSVHRRSLPRRERSEPTAPVHAARVEAARSPKVAGTVSQEPAVPKLPETPKTVDPP